MTQQEVDTTEAPVPVEVMRAILDQEIKVWLNTRYLTQVRRRVQKAIGNTEQEAELIKELERIERGLDTLQQEYAALAPAPA